MTHDLHGNLHNKIDCLIEDYKDNVYVMGRLINYIENTLPTLLENADKNNIERLKRKEELASNSYDFINKFLLANNYYYCSQNDLFIYYDKLHFLADSEDNILYKILTNINKNNELSSWKHKIKINILKKIKEKSPLSTIPESSTIQYVLKMLLPFFNSRNHVKYFLTVIGDIIHNKSNNIYYCSVGFKKILNELNLQINTYFGTINLFNNIKYKIYDHKFEICRILYINNENIENINIPDYFSKYILDIICVCSHYSVRYKTADNFLNQCNEKYLINHSYYLHKNSSNQIVDDFIDRHIEKCPNSIISSKNMLFIWKKYLKDKQLPHILFHDTLLNKLKEKLAFSENNFKNVTCMILPIVVDFKKYWDNNIFEDDDMYEVEEICKLFKNINKKYDNFEDKFFLELIRHLYPSVNIDNDKYIHNVKCNMWNKKQEVYDYIILFKNEILNLIATNTDYRVKSITDIYHYYLSNKKNNLIVSKDYFEKVAKDEIYNYIDEHHIISKTWFTDN
tara:strand:- start:11871 stop:13400 length:1530 start_codon:yes stop_codon:yes gene_type:complete